MRLRSALVVLAACASAPRSPPLPPTADPAAYQGAEGFQSLNWGVSSDDARRLLPDLKKDADNHFERPCLVNDRPAVAHYLFSRDRFAKALVVYTPEGAGAAEYVRADLAKQYGEPALAKESRVTPSRSFSSNPNAQRDMESTVNALAVLAAMVGMVAAPAT